jgi:hypothetical protein
MVVAMVVGKQIAKAKPTITMEQKQNSTLTSTYR